MQEIKTWVLSLGGENTLEKEMATHSSQCFCLENPMDRGPWWATVHALAESDVAEVIWHACKLCWVPSRNLYHLIVPILLRDKSCYPWFRDEVTERGSVTDQVQDWRESELFQPPSVSL